MNVANRKLRAAISLKVASEDNEELLSASGSVKTSPRMKFENILLRTQILADFLMQCALCSTPGRVYEMLMIRNQRHYVKRFTFVSPSAVFAAPTLHIYSYYLLLCWREAKLEHFFLSCAASATACGLCESDSFLI